MADVPEANRDAPLTVVNAIVREKSIMGQQVSQRTRMSHRASALRTAIVVGLLCLFALGRVAYAAHQCYRLTGGSCGGGVEQLAEAAQDASHAQASVCAEDMQAPDDRGGAGALTYAAFAIAPATALAFVPAPDFQAPHAVHLGPPPTHVTPLTSFGRLRL